MLEQGLIEELRESPDPASADERRRYYALTALGRAVALAEARRVTDMLSQARADRPDSAKAVSRCAPPIVYRVLLWCYPAPFRREYGREMVGAFDAELRDARRAGRLASASAAIWAARAARPRPHRLPGASSRDAAGSPSRPPRPSSPARASRAVAVAVAGPRHRRQHRDLQPAEQRAADARCRCATRRSSCMLTNPDIAAASAIGIAERRAVAR